VLYVVIIQGADKMMENTAQSIRHYIAENILFSGSNYPYSDDTSFLNEGVLDSMNILQLVEFVEKQFHISIDDQDIVPANFDSVTRLAAFIDNQHAPEMNTALSQTLL
jgi:acyl carrier protein